MREIVVTVPSDWADVRYMLKMLPAYVMIWLRGLTTTHGEPTLPDALRPAAGPPLLSWVGLAQLKREADESVPKGGPTCDAVWVWSEGWKIRGNGSVWYRRAKNNG